MNHFMPQLRRFAAGWLLLGVALLTGAAPTGALAETARQAQTGDKEAARKFATDDVLRQGMVNIAVLFDASWPAIRDDKLQGAAYRKLADDIAAQTQQIVRNCKLDARSDKAFHVVLSDINQSLEMMRRDKLAIQRSGALALAQALRNYAKYFDHPGWPGPAAQ
jgi:hypothetical protein